MYLQTCHEYAPYYAVVSVYCSSVWSQSEDDKLFISWGSLKTALRTGECESGYSCIIQPFYIRPSDTYMHVDTCRHVAADVHRRAKPGVSHDSIGDSLLS